MRGEWRQGTVYKPKAAILDLIPSGASGCQKLWDRKEFGFMAQMTYLVFRRIVYFSTIAA